jgi:hypothetical protein
LIEHDNEGDHGSRKDAMKHVVVGALVVALSGPSVRLVAADRGNEMTAPASISGTAATSDRHPLAQHAVRLRDLDRGVISVTSETGAGGQYTFTSVLPGRYLVEVVDGTGAVLGTSSALSIEAGAVLTGIHVSAVSGSATARNTADRNFFKSTSGLVLLAAAGAGVVATTAAVRKDASPTR